MKHAQSCDDHPKYRNGCKPCLARKLVYNKRHKLLSLRGQRLSTAPDLTRQRLQQLRALGYSVKRLADATGLAPATVWRLSSEPASGWLQLGTFHAVEKAWRELCEFPATAGGYAERAARVAAEHGWEAPALLLPAPEDVNENDIDEIAVERAVAGDRVPLTRAESAEAWRRLEERGQLSLREIARQLHTSEKTVSRWRSGENRPSTTRARRKSA